MGAEIKGMDKLEKNFARLSKKYGENVAKATVTGAQLVRTSAVKSIQSVSSGDTVTRYRNGGGSYSHTASKPGDAPNTDTGALAGRTLQVDVRREGVYVGSSLEYAPMLEFGTSKMRARPWLNPALESNRRKIQALITNAVKRTK